MYSSYCSWSYIFFCKQTFTFFFFLSFDFGENFTFHNDAKIAIKINNVPNNDRFNNLMYILHDSFSAKFTNFQDSKKKCGFFITNFFLVSLQEFSCLPPDIQIEIVDLRYHYTENQI